jgi:hypothetical protein
MLQIEWILCHLYLKFLYNATLLQEVDQKYLENSETWS